MSRLAGRDDTRNPFDEASGGARSGHALRGDVLSESDQARVHEESLRIPAEVGVRYHGELALPLLADTGAEVDRETGIVRMALAVVEATLATAPRSFTLGARDAALGPPRALDGGGRIMNDRPGSPGRSTGRRRPTRQTRRRA